MQPTILRFFPAIVLAAILLPINWYFLWETRTDQISGDVLIHLIFARNFAEGRWFEFSHGQISRANTTFLWEWILALFGVLTNQIRSQEGFLTLTRVLAMVCVVFAGWKSYQWGKLLGLSSSAASVVCVFVFLNPVTFYWTAVNPMETALALVFAVLICLWFERLNRFVQKPWKEGLIGGLLIFGLSQTRPEFLAAGPIAAIALILGHGGRAWRLAMMVILVPFAMTAGVALWLAVSGFPVLPSSSVARRLMMLTYDASPLPIIDLPANLDAIKILFLWSPMLLLCLYAAFFGKPDQKPLYFFALGICAFSGLFFSLFQYTTWQGRYMLPALAILVVPSMATVAQWKENSSSRPSITDHFKTVCRKASGILWLLGLTYGLLLCALSMRSLARFADAPNQRPLQPTFVEPPANAKTFLVQEVQSAYFHPELLHISSEGLISPEAYHAYKKGQSLYDFILELKPDLIGFGNYYLNDPDGLREKINTAAVEGKDLHYRGLRLTYQGNIAGAGPFFTAEYPGP